MKNWNIFGKMLGITAIAVVLWACQADEPFEHGIACSDIATISFYSDPLEEHRVTTRVSDIKDDDEKRIKSLHIFFFDTDGNYLPGTYLEGYPGATKSGGYYSPGEGVTILKIANLKDNFNNDDEIFNRAKSAVVYAVANVDDSFFRELDENGRPKNVPDMAALEGLAYAPGEGISLGLPQAGMPMIGKKTVDLTATGVPATNDERSILLKALMARVDVNISLASDVTDGRLPALTLVEWSAKNLPTKVAFKEPGKNVETGEDETTGEIWDDWGQTGNPKDITTPLQRTIYNKNGNISFSFYMFENVQNNKTITYPEDTYNPVLGIDKRQNYKPYCGADTANSAAVELHAFYSTYNDNGGNATYEVYYTLYLGSNHTNNFKVKRNHQYKNDITIKGLTAQSSPTGMYTFDARVNVDENDNEFYIAMLRERNHDAHFCVTPMDVHFFEEGAPTMEVILGKVPEGSETPQDGSVPDWIGMEKVPASDMLYGTVANVDKQLVMGKNFTAGHGKRKYFTTSLLGELETHVTLDANRDRVYFYLDENLTMADRSATVTLIYKNGTKEKRRTILIEQVPLLKVEVYGRTNDSDLPNYKDHRQTIYMEQFEEYLDHYDPLDVYASQQVYPGLPWGLNGTFLHGYGEWWPSDDWANVYFNGVEATENIIKKAGQENMTMGEPPESAAQYCHNKNKRNSSGNVPSTKWFLPGITQLEDGLSQYYLTFPEFQKHFYWSAAAGKRYNVGYKEDANYARATKVFSDGHYAVSDVNDYYVDDNGTKGKAERTKILRIRAFRWDLNRVE